jgi:hypothetical protein
MKVIPTKDHGVLDYVVSVLLIASPWLFNFANGEAEMLVPVLLGASSIIYSLFTDYELSISKSISMRAHLTLDFISGLFLTVSPWLLGLKKEVYVPFMIFGLLEMGVVLLSDTGRSHKRDSSAIPGKHHVGLR